MIFSRFITLFHLVYIGTSCYGWTPKLRFSLDYAQRMGKSSSSWPVTVVAMSVDVQEEEDVMVNSFMESSRDGTVLTTKTKKNIIFDEESGRFFETEQNSPNADDSATYTIPPEFASDEMVPTELLFQKDIAKRLQMQQQQQKQEQENLEYELKMKQRMKQETEQEQLPSPSPSPSTEQFSSNEMVPTEILFQDDIKKRLVGMERTETESVVGEGEGEGESESQKLPDAEMKDLSIINDEIGIAESNIDVDNAKEKDDTYDTLLDDQSPSSSPSYPRPKTIVEKCYEAWNSRNMDEVVSCFSDKNLQYDDTQYIGKITTKTALTSHFTQQANLLPTGSQIVLENIAISNDGERIGTRWYVKDSDGSKVPFTSGCSFYHIDINSGLISRATKASEMIVKPSKEGANILVSSAANVFNQGDQSGFNSQNYPQSTSSLSIIETYFEAWNNRDMESALDCFVDDCVYETEDPMFVDKFFGKDALRNHLLKNAKSLPATCRIILDDIAIDEMNGNIGTRWHLEINDGISIPNLSGCSMYTTSDDGRLKTGYDVTEAPVKVPRAALSILSLPARLLFTS